MVLIKTCIIPSGFRNDLNNFYHPYIPSGLNAASDNCVNNKQVDRHHGLLKC